MAAQQPSNQLTISTLRGGLDDNDPPLILPDDTCTIAENVEFFYSSLGERRLGCAKISDLPSFLSGQQAVTWMGRHYPDNNVSDAELWALGQNLTGSTNAIGHRTTTGWSQVTPVDSILTTQTYGYGSKLTAVSLHGKFYISYKSGIDLLHVWDGTSLRQTGLAQPSAPSVATEGSGSYTGTRYFRVRYVILSGSTVTLRSEPSSVATFTPGGTGAGTTVTKPGSINLGETHWEVEASTDNANFYRIIRVPVSQNTYNDELPFTPGYSSYPLSEDLTQYTRIPSGKFLSVDTDRLLIAGSWENPLYGSRIWWTPTQANTGVGNDERLDMTVNPYLDLDNYDGGEITAISKAVNGYLYVFKWGAIYKLVRTGQLTAAYSAVPMTTARGALPGTLVEAVDQTGSPALYFLDPRMGPMRIGQYGLEWAGRDLRTTWARVNLQATTPGFGIYYQNKNQVHFWIAVDGADHPNMKIIVQCNEMRSFSLQSYGGTTEGARRGWATTSKGSRISDAHCAIMFDDNVDSVGARSQNLVPYIGKEQWTVNLGQTTVTDFIQKCDTGSTDALATGASDPTAYFYATIQSKAYLPVGLLSLCGIMAGSIMAGTLASPENNVYINVLKNFGVENQLLPINLTQQASETLFVKKLDEMNLSECRAVQFQFGDLNTDILTPITNWRLHAFSAKIRPEQSQ